MPQPETIATTIEAQPMRGIGGWLALMAVGQIVGPFLMASSILVSYTGPDSKEAFAKLPTAMYGGLGIDLAILAFVIGASVIFFLKKKIFKIIFTIEVLLVLLSLPLESGWISMTTGVSMDQVFPIDQMEKNVGTSLINFVWVWYVWVSDRVKNTFVN